MMAIIMLWGVLLLITAAFLRWQGRGWTLPAVAGVLLIGHALTWWTGLAGRVAGPLSATVALLFGPMSIYLVGILLLVWAFSVRGPARPIAVVAGLGMLSPIIAIVVIALMFMFAAHH